MSASTPDDLREAGWSVAIHNDYHLDGKRYTFWLVTKDSVAVKGEGETDEDALTQIRLKLATGPYSTSWDDRAFHWQEVINKALRDKLEGICDAIWTAMEGGKKFPESVGDAMRSSYRLLRNTRTRTKAIIEATVLQDQGDDEGEEEAPSEKA